MDSLVSFQKNRKPRVTCYACFARVLHTLRSMPFLPCCALSFDEATHYGAPHTLRKGMEALVLFPNNPKSRVPRCACFARVLRTLRSTDF